jgi:hypothetical protein
MTLRTALPFVACLSFAAAGAGCTAASSNEGEETSASESDLTASRIQQLGPIASGAPKTASYTTSPLYRAYSFEAKQGDSVDIWVRSTNGDAVAWLLRSTYASVVRNDDASASTNDAHITATIGADGQYFVAFKEAKGKNADFTVSFTRTPATPANDGGGAPDSGPASNDAFSPSSCSGAPLDFVSKFVPGSSEAVLADYQIVLRKRQCNSVTGCSPWVPTTEHAGPSGHGKATLAVNPTRLVLVGDEAASPYGTPKIDLGTKCTLDAGGAVTCGNYYATGISQASGAFLVGPRDVHYRVGVDGVGGYHIDGDNVALAGTITNHCARLSGHPTGPDPIYPDAPYNDFEAAILIRY